MKRKWTTDTLITLNKIIAILLIALCSCKTNQTGIKKPLTDKVVLEKLQAKLKVFNLNDDSTRVYFNLQTRNQDYFLLQNQNKYKAAYLLTCQIYKLEQGKKVKTDSSSMKLIDVQKQPLQKNILAYFDTPVSKGNQYELKISIVNLDNNARFEHSLKFTTTNCNDPENLVLLSKDLLPSLEKNFTSTEGIIRYKKGCNNSVSLYRITGGVKFPAPPFGNDENFSSSNMYTPEKTSVEKSGDNEFSFSSLVNGVYSIQSENNSGIVFYHFNQWYPNCNDTSAFYEPLIYITSKEEFQTFSNYADTRKNFEQYWLQKAGSEGAARNAIKAYYKRVFEANKEFTAVTEGWRTDRGMIHIVFGKPDHVEKQFKREIWYYRSNYNSTLSFIFQKIDNPYSDNDYRLDRDPAYKPEWYNAVQNWRSGKPFSLNKGQ